MEEGILTKPYIATVMKTDPDERKVAVFIPNLMPTMQAQKSQSYSIPTNNGLKLQALTKNVSATVTKTNYVWVRNWYKNDPMPKEGSKVIVYFLDGNVLLGFWKKFDPNGDFEPIDSEKYKKLFGFSVNGSEDDVYDSDSVSISMPSNFKAIISNSGKSKSVSIQENYSFYKGDDITKAINDLQKSVEYLSKKTADTMLAGLSAIQYSSVTDSDLKAKIASDIEIGKSKISNSDNLSEANDFYETYLSLASSEANLFSSYSSYKQLYAATSESDKTALDSALGKSLSSDIESKFSYLKGMALKAVSSSEGASILSKTTDFFPAEVKLEYSFYYDSKSGTETMQNIVKKTIESSATAFSQYQDPSSLLSDYSSKICHNGILSSISVIGWKSTDGIDMASAKLLYKSMTLEPVLFGLYATAGELENSIIVDVCDDPGYQYSATMKTGTADPISITSFPVRITAGDNPVTFEIKYSTTIDLTLTISA
jgi:hypothetical protein